MINKAVTGIRPEVTYIVVGNSGSPLTERQLFFLGQELGQFCPAIVTQDWLPPELARKAGAEYQAGSGHQWVHSRLPDGTARVEVLDGNPMSVSFAEQIIGRRGLEVLGTFNADEFKTYVDGFDAGVDGPSTPDPSL